jgi:hypothetical protein
MLTTVFYGIQETGTLPFPTATGGSNRRERLGRREEKAYQHNGYVQVSAVAAGKKASGYILK